MNTRDKYEMVPDAEMAAAFEGSNFGTADKRELVDYGVLKIASGYSDGYTIICIMQELGLLTKARNVSRKGRRYMYAAFGPHTVTTPPAHDDG